MDVGLDRADAGDGRRRPRGDAGVERVSADGAALEPRLLLSAARYPAERRAFDRQDEASAVARRSQPDPLLLAAWLVLRADADPDRPGGDDRIYHGDLGRDSR